MATGTLRLPVTQNSSADELRALRHRLRELDFHPERYLVDGTGASIVPSSARANLIAEKRRWIEKVPTKSDARQRCQAIRRVNQELQSSVSGLRESWATQIARLTAREQSEGIFASREYAFSVFPQLTLTNFLLPILENPFGSG